MRYRRCLGGVRTLLTHLRRAASLELHCRSPNIEHHGQGKTGDPPLPLQIGKGKILGARSLRPGGRGLRFRGSQLREDVGYSAARAASSWALRTCVGLFGVRVSQIWTTVKPSKRPIPSQTNNWGDGPTVGNWANKDSRSTAACAPCTSRVRASPQRTAPTDPSARSSDTPPKTGRTAFLAVPTRANKHTSTLQSPPATQSLARPKRLLLRRERRSRSSHPQCPVQR